MMNMRRTLKQPTLRMNTGGDTSALDSMNRATAVYQSMQTPDPAALTAKAMAAPAAPLTQGQFNHDRILAAGARTQMFQPTMQLAQQEPARISPMMLREGGDGGPVPGKGTGDKIPALYEPGEFVVSNDMLKAQPGLRSQLHDLRGNVLAAQGKTVAQADAEALDYDGGPQGEQHGRENAEARAISDTGKELRDRGSNRVGPPVGERQPRQGLGGDQVVGRPTLRALDGFTTSERPWNGAVDDAAFGKTPKYIPPPVNPTTGVYTAQGPTATSVQPVAAAPKLTPYGAGQQLRTFVDSAKVQGLNKLVGAANAFGDSKDAVDSFNSGDGAGVLHGAANTVADVAGTFAGRAGNLGLAYGAGHFVGSHVVNPMLSTETKDSIGSGLNTGVKALGKVFSQDWGYTPSSQQPATATAAPAAPTPRTTPPNGAGTNQAAYDKANADVSDGLQNPTPRTANVSVTRQTNGTPMFSGQNIQGPVTYDGDAAKSLRNPGSTFSVMPGMSQALIDKTLTNSDGSRWTAQDEATARANLRDGVDVNRGTSQGRATDATRIPGIGEFGHNKAVAAQLAREQNITQRRGQDITSADGRYGHELTSQSNRARLRYDMDKDQRDFKTGRDDKGFEQQLSADKAWTEHTAATFRTKDDKGNDVPDTQKAAAYTTAVDNTIGQLIPQFAKSPDPKMRTYAEDLTKRGRAALDKEDLANLQVMFERQQVHARSAGGLNPLKSGGPTSQNLLDYKITGKDSSWFQNRSKTAGGQTIPDVNLRHGADANYVMPNFGAGSTYLTPNKLRGE